MLSRNRSSDLHSRHAILLKARVLAARHSLELDRKWRRAKARGHSLKSTDEAECYRGALETVHDLGLPFRACGDLSDSEFVARLRLLLRYQNSTEEQQAILGLVQKPRLTLGAAFERFWEHIRDEWLELNTDQQRCKRNVYFRAIQNFRKAVGDIPLYEIKREHALAFRSWWLKRVEREDAGGIGDKLTRVHLPAANTRDTVWRRKKTPMPPA